MSFINKNLGSKPSLVKPISIIVVILLLIGGAYTFFGNKFEKINQDSVSEIDLLDTELKSSGLDKSQRINSVGDVEEVIAKWVEANPQAILQSVAAMQKKLMEEQAKNAQKNIGNKKKELFNDKNSPKYAPRGYDITIVEFFDYACGYCKRVNKTVQKLLKSDRKIKIVYKEFPILGKPSMEMSQVAIAVNMVSPSSYKKFHNALMKSNKRGKSAAIDIAKSVGVNVSKLKSILRNKLDEIDSILQANLALGNSIGIRGTPAFVIDEELVPGALELSSLQEKIANARKK